MDGSPVLYWTGAEFLLFFRNLSATRACYLRRRSRAQGEPGVGLRDFGVRLRPVVRSGSWPVRSTEAVNEVSAAHWRRGRTSSVAGHLHGLKETHSEGVPGRDLYLHSAHSGYFACCSPV